MHGGEDLLERGWGWDSLVTSESSPEDMPTYKKYLKDYYSHNTAESVAQAWQNEHQRDANTASNGTGVGTVLLPTLANFDLQYPISCLSANLFTAFVAGMIMDSSA